jgi:hypothetical protein
MNIGTIDKTILGFLLTIIGTIVGWLMNELSQWFKNSREEKRILKKVIFNLLETYNIYLRSDIEKEVKYITDIIHSEMKEFEKEKYSKEVLQNFLQEMYEITSFNVLKNDINKIKKNYENSINELSQINPIIAYRLSGETDFFERFESAEVEMNNMKMKVKNFFLDNTDFNSKEIIRIFRPEVLERIKKTLKSELLNLSKSISFCYKWKMKKMIEKMEKKYNENFKQKFKEIIIKLKSNIK